MATIELAILGGGCFWCLEAVYRQIDGILKVESGYAGGHSPQPSYETVCSGQSDHAEVVRLTFQPQKISYRTLLDIFFTIHDPTTLNRQGHDIGKQYRSIIVALNDTQLKEATEMIADLNASRQFSKPIVTEIASRQVYWPAEIEHQNYYSKHLNNNYCSIVIATKLEKFRKRWPQYIDTKNIHQD